MMVDQILTARMARVSVIALTISVGRHNCEASPQRQMNRKDSLVTTTKGRQYQITVSLPLAVALDGDAVEGEGAAEEEEGEGDVVWEPPLARP